MKDISQELEWMQVEEHLAELAATGSGGMGTDVTTLIEVVEPSSVAAVGGRLLVRRSSSHSLPRRRKLENLRSSLA